MTRIISIVAVLILGAALMYGALSSHFVRTSKGWLWISKEELSLRDTYVDIRKWGAKDFDEHPAVVKRLIDTGHGDVVASEAIEGLKGRLRDLLED